MYRLTGSAGAPSRLESHCKSNNRANRVAVASAVAPAATAGWTC